MIQQPKMPLQQQAQQNATHLLPSTSLDSSSSEHANGGDWQEEVYQKIKTMKEMYLHDLNDMYQKISLKLLQHDSLPQQLPTEQLEKLKIFKVMLDRIISFLQVSKNDVLPRHKEMVGSYEKQIINFLNTVRARKPMPRMQQGRLTGMQPMQQPQYQISQLQSNENQMNPQSQPMNMQGSLPSILDENFRPKMPLQQQTQHNAANLLPSQSQPSEPQPQQQQLMSQIQSQPTQLQQQLGLQQQPNQLQRDLQQRLQASGQGPGSMLQPQSVIDQQKQLYQSQRSLPEMMQEQNY